MTNTGIAYISTKLLQTLDMVLDITSTISAARLDLETAPGVHTSHFKAYRRKMAEWVRIENQEMMERFLNTVEGLHDSILREVALQNAGYVDVDGWMHGDLCLPNISLLFQSQSPRVIGVEILLEAVSELALKFPREFDEVEGDVLEQFTILHPLGRSNSAKIVCKIASYRMLGVGSRGMKGMGGSTTD